jgi:hypothetical protein
MQFELSDSAGPPEAVQIGTYGRLVESTLSLNWYTCKDV